MRKIREWISIRTAISPELIVLVGIMAANILFISIAAFIISWLAPPYLEATDYWSCVYYAVTMLISGYMEVVVEDIGQTGALLVAFCVAIVVLGMIVFTGAVVGYMTDFISSFIEDADSSSKKLHISNHTVILNWNTRAAEIVNELLYKDTKEKVVILVEYDREGVLSDIDERLSDTIETENELVMAASEHLGAIKRWIYRKKNSFKSNLAVIVREGDTWSLKQLSNISIESAKSVIILSNANTYHERESDPEHMEKGDAVMIKTLLQVIQITQEEGLEQSQQVVVEVEDDWTLELIETIISHKELDGKLKVIPVAIDYILGQIFSQISIMPELNNVYSALFSNRAASFHSEASAAGEITEEEFVESFLGSHLKAIPLAVSRDRGGAVNCFCMSNSEQSIKKAESVTWNQDIEVEINEGYKICGKHVLILGHNSKNKAIMEGFDSFNNEWKDNGADILEIVAVDSEEYLQSQDYYSNYPCVKKAVAADVFDKAIICSEINDFVQANNESRCILILSDDTEDDDEIDADVLTYLILVQDIINKYKKSNPEKDHSAINLVVEILNPKNYDIVSNFSANTIVLSNRYLSKIIEQIGEKEALFDFYYDILTYDEPLRVTKELYVKKASEYFAKVPEACTAADLIRAVYKASPSANKALVLGYFQSDGGMVIFEGDQSKINVELSSEDKLIVFSNH
ncbi:MAG: hypothetical protein FWG30_04915 [Eubacteriaceae bacterium]|nr:hypothetical protein [Eubacteriaceae bacterium]